MQNLLNAVKCVECHCISQSPLALPCGKPICSKHINSKQNHTTTTNHRHHQNHTQPLSYQCKSCGRAHRIPDEDEGGCFPPNEAVNLLIDLQMSDYKHAYSSCQHLQTLIEQLDEIHNEPKKMINETIGDLRAKIHAKRDELIKEIECASDEIVDELNAYEVECEARMASASRGLSSANHGLVAEERDKVSRFLDELNRVEAANVDNWKSILAQSEEERNELLATIENYKTRLFLDKFEVYRERQAGFCRLQIRDCLDNDDDRFGSVICLCFHA